MLWSRRANGIALTWGHTRLSETDFRLIIQESPGFIHGECQRELKADEEDIFKSYSALKIVADEKPAFYNIAQIGWNNGKFLYESLRESGYISSK